MNNFTIISINHKDTKEFLAKYHYLGTKGFRSSIIYGLYDTDILFGVCVFHGVSVPETVVGAFGLPRTDQHGFYELGRLAMHPTLNGGNHTSWFVSRAIKQLRRDTGVSAIISYADSSAGHIGSIYRACNALYCGMSAPKKDYYVDGKIKERGVVKNVGGEWKPRPQKHRYVWVFDKTLTLKWKVESCNWDGIKKGIKVNTGAT
jgi:hypothetical protein